MTWQFILALVIIFVLVDRISSLQEGSNKSIIFAKAKELFSIDLRSLAVFRICLGLVLIVNLLQRVSDIKAFYSDEGILPRRILFEEMYNTFVFSLHLMSGSVLFQGILLFIAFVSAFAMLIGFRTKIAVFLSWILFVSLISRNLFVNDTCDLFLGHILFWCNFLPLNAYYSMDCALNENKEKPPALLFSGGTAGLLCQITFIYFFAGLLQLRDPFWAQGMSMYYAISEVQHGSELGVAFLHSVPLFWIQFLSYFVVYLESFCPLFLFSPMFTTAFRMLGLFLLVLMNLVYGMFFDFGLFPWINVCSLIVFIPSLFWDRLFSSSVVQNFFNQIFRKILQFIEPVPRYNFSLSFKVSMLNNALSVFFLVYILFLNLQNFSPNYKVPEKISFIGVLLQLQQNWGMFLTDGIVGGYNIWYVIPAKLKDGKEIDLFSGETPVKWTKPRYIASLYKNRYWKKYMVILGRAYYPLSKRLPYFADFYCRDWNSKHQKNEHLETLDVYVMSEVVLPNHKTSSERKVLLWHRICPEA